MPPGACLGVVVRHKATKKSPRARELVITCDDPAAPVKRMELLTYTIWNAGEHSQIAALPEGSIHVLFRGTPVGIDGATGAPTRNLSLDFLERGP